LNIGIDSFVFLDDSSFERGLIANRFPEAAVPQLPDDPSLYPEFLSELDYFNFHEITQDDLKRNKSYITNRERGEFAKSFSDITEYYRSLKMVATIKVMDNYAFPRLLQLIQKTNQFNLTTRRYTEAELKILPRIRVVLFSI